MKQFILVTGNPHKLAEWKRLLPSDFQLKNVDADLDEIQSLELDEIILDKAKRAYKKVGKPIVVEDISAGLDKLQGLPGTFVKFFEKRLGNDALFQLADKANDPMTVQCAIAYYDGSKSIIVRSEVKGTVVASRGKGGFGFDHVFVPLGQTKTYAEMTPDEKDTFGHRGKAVQILIEKLSTI